MDNDKIDDIIRERERQNKIVLEHANLEMKRFFSLDSQIYRSGELSSKMKELMGLVASVVLRCNDCIVFHVNNCYNEEVTEGEFVEALSIALIVGGSIVIPHLRKAFTYWDELIKQ